MKNKKLTPYEVAGVWGEIDVLAYNITRNIQKSQNTAEFYNAMDKLRDLERKLKWHEVAILYEKGEQNERNSDSVR